jgi:hypothetical protein
MPLTQPVITTEQADALKSALPAAPEYPPALLALAAEVQPQALLALAAEVQRQGKRLDLQRQMIEHLAKRLTAMEARQAN